MKYQILLVDVPWRYSFSKSKSRKIENQYKTMSKEEMKKIPLMDIADGDSVMFFWTPFPKLFETYELINTWNEGLPKKEKWIYTTGEPWDKVNIGMGYWWRSKHELLLLFKRGSPSPPLPENRLPSGITEKRGKHSTKPIKAYEQIETMFPERSKVELFARNTRPGWTSLGLEIDGKDIIDAIKELRDI